MARDLKSIIILLVVCLILFFLIVGYASGIDTSTPTPTPTMKSTSAQPSNTSITRQIYQGSVNNPAVVYWGETIDMTAVSGWYGKVMRVPGYELVDVSSFTRKIYIDPAIFPEGMWYQWAPYSERNANTIAFRVQATRPSPPPGPDVINQTVVPDENQTASATHPTRPNYVLPERKVLEGETLPVDIVVAKGDGVNFTSSLIGNSTKAWIFGRIDGIYDYSCPNASLQLNVSQINDLEAGTYRILLINKGDMSVPKLVYNTSKQQVQYEIPPPLSIVGYAPSVVYAKFKDWMARYSDDSVDEIIMQVQAPHIEIVAADEIMTGENNVTRAIDIYGYTNVAPGTKVRVIWDEDKQNARTIIAASSTATVYGPNPGSMREFHATLPLWYNNTPVGEHFITARITDELYSRVQWWIYDDYEYNIHVPARQKYSAGNLFVETPTPVEIVREVVRTVTITVTVVRTPVPTPTPTPLPWYLQPPWSMFLSVIVGILGCLVTVWVLWKWDVI